jgi:hypothetical protein
MNQASNFAQAQNSLADHVFKDLLEQDMLGFLLSPVHLAKQLIRMTATHQDGVSEQIKRALASADGFASLHEELLSKSDGFFIQEADYDEESLGLVLDERYDASWVGDEAEEDFLSCFERLGGETLVVHTFVVEQSIAHRRFYQTAGWETA